MLNGGSMVWGFCVYFVYMIPLETDVLRKHRFQKSRCALPIFLLGRANCSSKCIYNSAHTYLRLTLYLLVLSVNNFCKQFGPRSGPTKRRTWSGSKPCDTLMVFLKYFFSKNLTLKKKHAKLPSRQFVTDSSSFKVMKMGRFASRKFDITCNFLT